MPARRVAKALGIGRGGVRRVERDGIWIYHAIDDGPTRAALMFRVGRGDEAAPDGGITHLVEHLALFPFAQRPYDYNGFVDPIRTVFVAAGKPDEVARHLTDVCVNLGSLPLDRLPTEQRVLRDEASHRAGGPMDVHAWLRWGLRGPGVTYLQELGLWRLSPEDVARWSSTWFTSGNAALVWIGSKLPAFDLPLPVGSRKPYPELVDLVAGPRWGAGPPNMVSISFPVPRTSADAGVQRILARRLQQRLRYEEGLSYDVSLAYQPLTATLASSCVTASAGASDAVRVRDVLLATAKTLEQDGPTDEDLATELDGLQRAREHPFFRQAEADRAAIQELLGADPETPEQLEAELAAVTRDDARQAFRVAMRRAILTQPQDVPAPPDWLEPYPNLIDATYPGKEFPHRFDSLIPVLRKKPALVVGPEGVSIKLRNGVGNGIGIRFEDVAVVVRHSSGPANVVHENGAEITIDPAYWQRAGDAIAMVEAAVPSEKRVVIDGPAGQQATQPAGPDALRSRRFWAGAIAAFLVLATIGYVTRGGGARVTPRGPATSFAPAGIGTQPALGQVLFGQSVATVDCNIAAPRNQFTFPQPVYWAARLRNGPYSPATRVQIVLLKGSTVQARWEGPEPVPTGSWSSVCSITAITRVAGTYDLKIYDASGTTELAWGHLNITEP